MRSVIRAAVGAAILILASRTAAQVANICPSTGVCFSLNIPETTASSGSGDIFFSISAPSTYEWVALGQGQSMGNSNMFVVYTASGGSNVTISPRTSSGHSNPTVNSDTKLTLLEGSSVSGGVMTANIKCSNCESWSGGTMDFSATNGNWIYAYQSSGGPKNSNDQSASIRQHNEHATFTWDFASAKGGNSANPLISTNSGSGTASGTQSCIPRSAAPSATATSANAATAATPTPTGDSNEDNNNNDDDDDDGRRPTQWGGAPTGRPPNNRPRQEEESLPYCDELPSGGNSNSNANNNNSGFTTIDSSRGSDRRTMLIAHGVLASLAFVILFPMGAITIRLASFPGVVWFHAAFQVFAYIIYIVAFGLGVYLATEMNLMDNYHPIIGILVLVLVFIQPISGWLHHLMFKKYSHRTLWSYGHIWLGRIAVSLGIVNGGLGLMLADTMNMSSKGGMVAYGIIAALMWLTWVAAMIIGERRRRDAQPVPSHKSSRSAKSTRSKSVKTKSVRSASSRHQSEASEVSTIEAHNIPLPPSHKSAQGSRSYRSATSRPTQSHVSGRGISEVSVD